MKKVLIVLFAALLLFAGCDNSGIGGGGSGGSDNGSGNTGGGGSSGGGGGSSNGGSSTGGGNNGNSSGSGNSTLPTLTGSVSIIGFARVEQILIADISLLGGSGTVSYQWKRSTTEIGTNSNSYNVQITDIGSTITVTVTRSGNSGSVTSAPTTVVTAEPPATPGLSFTLLSGNNAYSVSRGTADAAEVVIPALYEGKPVTIIEANGFSSYTNMTSVLISGRITNIGQNAFYNCSSLKSVIIPNNVTSISSNAFNGCTSLTSITIPFFGSTPNGTSPLGYLFGTTNYSSQNTYIPPSLKTVIITGGNSIPNNAFYGCTNLTSIIIPDTVSSIGQSAFYGCTSLPSITIPNTVTSIGQSTFSGCTNLMNINIPSGVTSINNSTFSGCTSLVSITIPDTVTSIGQSAFSGCTNLMNINIPSGITNINISTFSDCTSLASITIPDSVTNISGGTSSTQGAFSGCTSLASITIGNSVASIGGYAFSGCTSLTSVTIPDNVTSIGDSAFRDCTSLASITLPFIGKSRTATTYEAVFGYIFGYTNNMSSTQPSGTTEQFIQIVSGYGISYYYYIPTSLKTVVITGGVINKMAFRNCTGLTSVTIGNSVVSIGESAFAGCTSLTMINYNATYLADLSGGEFYNAGKNTTGIMVNIGANVTKIPAYLFRSSDTNISAINFASGSVCQSIGNYAFYGCGMTSITIPNSVTSIGDYTFCGCTGMTSITIPISVKNIGNYAFDGCGMTSITIPNSVTSIGDYVFGHCSNLTRVTIPNSVTSIGYYAFGYCIKLTCVTFQGTINANNFDVTAFGYSSSTGSPGYIGNLRNIFYTTDSNGTPGTYTRESEGYGGYTWTRVSD